MTSELLEYKSVWKDVGSPRAWWKDMPEHAIRLNPWIDDDDDDNELKLSLAVGEMFCKNRGDSMR